MKYFIFFTSVIFLLFSSCENKRTRVPLTSNRSLSELHRRNNNNKGNLTSHSVLLSKRPIQEEYHFKCTDQFKRVNDTTMWGIFELLNYRYEEENPDFALFDWNGDGYDDLFFEYYASSGTGIKFRVDVDIYDPKTEGFKEKYSFMNPAYFCDSGIITSHYWGNGGGWAEKYSVHDDSIELIENIDIKIFSDQFKIDSVVYFYTQSPFQDTIRVTDNMVQLPPEYTYEKLINID